MGAFFPVVKIVQMTEGLLCINHQYEDQIVLTVRPASTLLPSSVVLRVESGLADAGEGDR